MKNNAINCGRRKAFIFSVLALSKLRDELLNTLDAKSVPCTFLVFPFKEDETEGDEEVISKDTLRSIVVFNEEIEEVKSLHLIGQSQTSFREWNQKWVDLTMNSFADIDKFPISIPSFII